MPAAKCRRRSRRPLLTVTTVLVVATSVAALSVWWWRPSKAVAPPTIDLTGVAPAVCQRVDSVRTAIVQSPDSATAWGKMGMVLMSHGLSVQASTACLAQAERLEPRQPRWPYLQAIAVLKTDPDFAISKLQRGSTGAARFNRRGMP